MANTMKSLSEQTILETFSWYFSITSNKEDQLLKENKGHAIMLGRMMASLKIDYICGLDNGELKDFQPNAEYELVGRGLLNPIYRLNHPNDNCYNYLSTLHSEIKSGYLDKLSSQQLDPKNLKALAPYVLLLMEKHQDLLKNRADIDFPMATDRLTKLKDKSVIRTLSEEKSLAYYEDFLSNKAEIFQTKLKNCNSVWKALIRSMSSFLFKDTSCNCSNQTLVNSPKPQK